MSQPNKATEIEEKCLKYLREGTDLLKRFREEAANISKTQTPGMEEVENKPTDSINSNANSTQPPSFSERVSAEFKQCFPSRRTSLSGKRIQTHLPNSGRKFYSPYPKQSKYQSSSTATSCVKGTWTHDFICLGNCNAAQTPKMDYLTKLKKAGLGRRKILFNDKLGGHQHVTDTLESYYPRLKSQKGAYHLMKGKSGGCGVKALEPLSYSAEGYDVPSIKEEARASVIYVVPLNSDIDMSPVNVNDITCGSEIAKTTCSKCNIDIALINFKEHKALCSDISNDATEIPDEVLEQSPFADECSRKRNSKSELLNQLRKIFPDTPEEHLRRATDSASDSNEAVEMILSSNVVNISGSIGTVVDKNQPSCSKEESHVTFKCFEDILEKLRKDVDESNTYTLKIDREEFWRGALSFYKKAYSDPSILKQQFEVQFSNKTGEDDSTDAGAIRMEFFEMVRNEFDKRIMEGNPGERVPRITNCFQFTLFGIFLCHSVIHGGCGYYAFQRWVYEVLIGKEDVLPIISKDQIPVNVANERSLNFINSIDKATNQEQLDKLVDENIQIINNVHWDPLVSINLSNKDLLGVEIIFQELVRKRLPSIKALSEGLSIGGMKNYIFLYPEYCREVFVCNTQIVTRSTLKSLIEKPSDTTYEKSQSFDYFTQLIENCEDDIPPKICKFATGVSEISPFDKKKIKIRFLPDDDTKLYPEAMACFGILNLPTVHSSKAAFQYHFLKALEIEGVGFSAPV